MKKNSIEIIKNNYVVDGDCHLWTMSCNTDGYPKVSFNNKMEAVHRLVYFNENPQSDRSGAIHHICGNRKCININHLQLVSHIDNSVESLRVKYLEKELETLRKIINSQNESIYYLSLEKGLIKLC